MSSALEQVQADATVDIPVTGLRLGDGERAAVERVLASGMLAQGPEVAAFETEFAEHVGGRPCVAVNSGTSALLLGLLALGIGRGDEVIVPSFTFAATANAVALTGATPVFVDVEPIHFCLDPDVVRAAITPRTAAVLAVHLYGHPAAVHRLAELAAAYGLLLVEDAAQAHLARLGGRPVGSFGQLAAFSFYPTKNMTAGEGGMAVCADEATARRIRLLRNQGMERRYANEIVGYNARMTDLHAAIGRVQLAQLPGWTVSRRRNAALLTEALASTADRVGLVLPAVAESAEPVWHQYTVRAPDRDGLVSRLAELGVPTGVYYPTPVHRLPAYDLDLDLPHTAAAAAEVLSLPVHPMLTDAHLERIVASVGRAARMSTVASRGER
jgi:dTDP-4-amino-4,6-dideoxygalactose transaminase